MQSIEVLNPQTAHNYLKDDKTEFVTTPYALQFSYLNSYEDSYKHLRTHPEMCTQDVADELLGEAFSQQMKGRSSRTESLVRQALVVQYVCELGVDKMDMFFARYSFYAYTVEWLHQVRWHARHLLKI